VFDLYFYFPLDDGLLPEENLADNLLIEHQRSGSRPGTHGNTFRE
jgi:hypothetical protein